MNLGLLQLRDAILHLAYPHVCEGCGTDLLSRDHLLCLRCLALLPATEFHIYSNNPIEKIFWGRLPLTSATAQYYFTRGSLIQHLLHQLKYRDNRELGTYLGKLMGYSFAASNRFRLVDALVPLPLHPSKERTRGYNQAEIICQGIAEVLNIPVLNKAVIRTTYSETQTKKSRVERWQNMENRFKLSDMEVLRGKHVLLIDDVITTGATLEACGRELLKTENIQLSVATLCYSSH